MSKLTQVEFTLAVSENLICGMQEVEYRDVNGLILPSLAFHQKRRVILFSHNVQCWYRHDLKRFLVWPHDCYLIGHVEPVARQYISVKLPVT